MGRKKHDNYWKKVTEEKGLLKCKHCGHKFKGGASRIKAHIDGIQGKGVAICTSVHKSIASSSGDVRREGDNGIIYANTGGLTTLFEGGNEIIDANTDGSMAHQNISGSFNLLRADNDHEMIEAIVTYSMTRQSNIESINLLEETGNGSHEMINAASQNNTGFHPFQGDIRHLKQVLDELVHEEEDIKEQLKWLKLRGEKRKRKVDDWLNQAEKLKCEASNRNYTVNRFGLVLSKVELTEEIRKHKKQKPLVLSNEIVGEGFDKNVKKMWKLLKDDIVSIIGIHGMGGVGKTYLVTYMENEIKRKGTFNHVFHVTVSHDLNISKLQHDIAEQIGAELNGDDEVGRARSLSLAFEAKGKSVLVLDDVWKDIDLAKVGIPLEVNGIKLIVTSRLERVCRRMTCSPERRIKICPLSDGEGWELFLLKLGNHGKPAILPSEIFKVARSVAAVCDGLPLGICVMARTMKRYLNDIHWWRHTLNKLRNLEMGEEMEEEVLKVLKLSYDNLMEKNLQDCFLHCALYYGVDRSSLIMKLVDNGLINGARTLQEIFDEGGIILDKLVGHSLLLLSKDYSIGMHGLVRNMAHLMIREGHIHKYMVKCNENLTKLPDLREWTSDLAVVSLMKNKIEEIPAGTSPPCPLLSTLILSDNLFKGIPECFFTHINVLAMLDLSNNDELTCLPDSLSGLRSLVSLVLRGCFQLKYLPPLGELKALSRLDISHTSIEEILGLEELINLKWLDLSWSPFCSFIRGSMLSGLTNLQYLDLRSGCCSLVTEEDLEKMSMLECFAVRFEECQKYNNYVQKIQDTGFGPKTYHLHSGIVTETDRFDDYVILPDDIGSQIVSFGDCEVLTTTHLLPRDLSRLGIFENHHWQCLCRALSCNYPSSLRSIEIIACTRLKILFCSRRCCSVCKNLQNLQVCHLEDLKSLTVLCKEDEDSGITPSLSWTGVFCRLRDLHISKCHEIEKLFTPKLLRQLQSLEKLHVEKCKSLKEIFAESNSGGDSITLPKLIQLTLRYLPELIIVFKATIVFESVPAFDIHDCPKLERFPIIITSAVSSVSFGSSDFHSSDSD